MVELPSLTVNNIVGGGRFFLLASSCQQRNTVILYYKPRIQMNMEFPPHAIFVTTTSNVAVAPSFDTSEVSVLTEKIKFGEHHSSRKQRGSIWFPTVVTKRPACEVQKA